MRRKLLISISLLVLAALTVAVPASRLGRSSLPPHSASSVAAAKNAAPVNLVSSYGKLPLTFEANEGQTDARVKFLARGSGYTVFLADDESTTFRLTDAEARSRWRKNPLPSKSSSTRPKNTDAVVRLSLVGSSSHAPVEGLDLQSGYSNYFIGSNPARWQRNIPQYARVKYRGVYPGIDLVYYGHQGQLESDYVLAAGANPGQILLKIEGAESIKLDPQLGAILSAKAGDIYLRQPVAYQEADGKRQEVAANYVQRGGDQIGIHVGPYDASQPLIIDPGLAYSTYLGGSSASGDAGNAIAADASGSAYVTGFTTSTDFPTTPGAPGTTLLCTGASNASDAFVTKFKPDGSGLVYSTYLGGSCNNGGADLGLGIAVDSNGEAFVTGQTASSDFPVTANAFQNANGGVAIFVSELNPTGTALLYSTYIHGNGSESGTAIAVDAAGNAYITGGTSSTTFPVRAPGGSPFQTTIKAPELDAAFVCRIDPTLTGSGTLVYATYLGGSGSEFGEGIAVDSNANVYVTGQTTSKDFPVTSNAFQTTLSTATASGNLPGNAFVTRLDLNQLSTSALIYSTYLGGSGSLSATEAGEGIALDPSFNAYVVGTTPSIDFPTTPNAFQTLKKATHKAVFVSRFDTNATSGPSSLIYSSYLSGSNDEIGKSIAVDSLGDAFVTGETASSDFPVTNNVPQPKTGGSADAFVTEFNPTGAGLLFSTYLGGTGLDFGEGIALDTASPPNVYITGGAESTNFPVTAGAFQTTFRGTFQNAFVTKLSPGALSGVSVSPASLDFGTVTIGSASTAQMVTLTNGKTTTLTISSVKFIGTNAADFSQSATTCATTLAAGANCTISVVFRPKVNGAESATMQVNDSDSTSPQTVALTGSGSTPGAPDFSLTLNPALATVTAGNSANFTATITSVNGFASNVSLTCTGAPTGSTCVLTPKIVTPGANATATSSGVVTTTALMIPPRLPNGPRPFLWIWVCTVLSLALALYLARIMAQRPARKLIWGVAFLLFVALAGCSHALRGGGKTLAGSYPLTVKGTSGALNHSATFTLTVQ